MKGVYMGIPGVPGILSPVRDCGRQRGYLLSSTA